jgi:hypothetical protein
MWWSATTCSFRLTGSLSLYVVSIAYALTNADNTCSLVRLSAAEYTHFVFATQSAMLGRESYVTKHQVYGFFYVPVLIAVAVSINELREQVPTHGVEQ